MSRLDRHVAFVQNKLAITRFLYALAWALLIFAAAVWIAVMVDRLARIHLIRADIWFWAGLGATVIAAIAYAIIKRPTAEAAAVAIDEKLALKEKFSTAMYVRPLNDPFAKAAVLDAERTAENVSLHKRFPVEWPVTGIATIALMLICTLTFFWMPKFDLLGREQARQRQEQKQIAQQAAKQVVQQALARVNATPKGVADEELIKRAQKDLTDLLNQPARDPEAVKRSAAKALQDVGENIKQQMVKSQRFADAQNDAKAFRSITPDASEKGPVADAQRAIAKGDFKEAVDQLEKAVEKFDKMDQEQKQKAIQQMKQMAQQLAQMAQNPQAQQQMQQQLQQLGANQQQAQQLANQIQQAAQGDKQAQQQLQQQANQLMQNMNAQQRQQLQQAMRQMQAQANTQSQAQQMSQSASQMAQAMQQQAAQNGQQNGQQQQNSQGQQQQQGQSQQMAKAQQAMNQQLQAMQAMQNDAQQVAAAQQAAQQAAEDAAGECQGGNKPGGKQGQGQNPQQWGGNGGQWQQGQNQANRQPGQGKGGFGPGVGKRGPKEEAPFDTKPELSRSDDIEGGKILASTLVKAKTERGKSTVGLREVVAKGEKEATDEVDQERISKPAQQAVKEYFRSVTEEPEQQK